MRGKKYKKLITWLLCICMIMGMIPSSAFAVSAEEQNGNVTATETSKDDQQTQEKSEQDEKTTQSSETKTSNVEKTTEEKTTEQTTTETKKEEAQEEQTKDETKKTVKKATPRDASGGAKVTAVKLAEKDGSVWGTGLLTGSGDLDDVSWNKTTGENKGCDSAIDNDIIRSFDSIYYSVSSTINLDQENEHILVYEITIPDDDELTLDEEKMNVIEPVTCKKNADGTKTYTCKYTLQKNYSGGEKEENVIIKVGNKHQGYEIKPTIKAYLDDNKDEALTVNNMETVTVTTAPMYNIVLKKQTGVSINRDVYNFDQTSTSEKTYYKDLADGYKDHKVTGYKCTYGFALEVRKSGDGIKGVEFPDPNEDFTFDIDLSNSTLNEKSLAENGFGPLLYYLGPNEAGGGAVTELPYTKEYENNAELKNKGCYNSGNVTMTQDGTTLHVKVKGFEIDRTKFPKENYKGDSYWEDLNKIREGIFSAFQFQVVYPYINEKGENLQEKLGVGSVNVEAAVKNMNAVSETGNKTTTETILTDNTQTNTWSLTAGNKRNQQIFYSDRKSIVGPYTVGQTWTDGDIAAVGAQDLAFTVSYLEEGVGEGDAKENLPVAIDQFVLFDRSAIQDVEFARNVQTSISSGKAGGYSCHVRYAVRKDGRMDNDSMRTATLDDFDFYDEKPAGGCDGVLVEYRGTNLGGSNLELHAQFKATVNKNADVADKVYMITAFTNTWTVSDFKDQIVKDTGKSLDDLSRDDISAWGKAQDVTGLVENKQPTQKTIDPRNIYTVPEYKEGVYTVDSKHKFHVSYADALYIVPYTTTVTKTVAQTDDKGDPLQRYNIGKGQKYVDYMISSSMKYWDDVKPAEGSTTTVYLEDTIPEGLTYIPKSAYWGGTYTSKYPEAGSVEGGQQIEPTITTKTENNKKVTVLKWAIPKVALKNGELPKLYYSCKISSAVKENQQLTNTVTIQTDEDKRPIYKELNNISETTVTVTRDKEFYIVKEGGDSLELEDNSYYDLIASNTSSNDKKDLWVFDTMPYDKDGKSKQFDGKYEITSLTMDAAEVNNADDMDIWYTDDEKYAGKSADDIDPSEITEGIWKKAKKEVKDGTITFTGEGLNGSWPTVIAYHDDNLEKNTIATLRLKYKAAAGAKKDEFTNTWTTMSNEKELLSKADTDVYDRSIEGTVWVDANKDGKIDDNETKLEGVKVTLLVKNEKGEYVPYESYHQTVDGKVEKTESVTYTDKDGHYNFDALPPGDYQVKFESSDGTDLGKYDVTEPNADKDVTKTSKVEKENAEKDNGELKSGTIKDITMPTLDEMVADKEKNGTSYNLPDQNLGLIVPTTEVSVTKKWEDNNDQDGKRPEKIEVTLYADGKETAKKQLNEEGNWTAKFAELPKYDESNPKQLKVINYTVKETTVPEGYESSISGTEKDGYTITNKYTSETINIPVEKKWNDANNQDEKRPAMITVDLYANGTYKDKLVLTADKEGNWKGTFTNLPKYSEGKEIKYTIQEETVTDYTSVVTGDAAKGYVVENTHKPATTEIVGSKTWKDSDNQDGKRPESITVRLLANGTEVANKEVTEKDNWSWKFDNLSKYEDGKEISYTVTEDAIKDYTTTVDGYNITNEHTPGKVSVGVTKSWLDENDQDGVRPEKITVHLYADGEDTGKELTLTKDNNWSGTFTDLAQKKAGKDIKYTVKEEKVDGYTSEVTGDATKGYVVENTHKPATTEIAGSKTWDDKDNQDGKRPESITIHLFANGVEVAKKTVKADDNWSWDFTNLPKYENGKEIIYTVTEDTVKDYTTTVDSYNVTNKHTPETTEISGSKTWNDKDNQDGIRPDSITVRLLANGKEVASKEVKADDNWSYSFKDLPKYENGKEIIYTVTEDTVKDYTTTVDGYNVTNSYTPGKTSVPVTKAWLDGNDQDGVRPEKITVHLYADGDDTGKTLELTAANNWSGTFTDLDVKKAGKTIEYTVKEDEVKDYTSKVTGDATKGYVVENTHKPATTEIAGSKTWDDKDNQDGKRPESITIHLFANGEEVASKEVKATDNWSWKFTDLPKNADGKEISYTVTEDTVDGYKTTVNGYNVTNKHTPETTEIAGNKTWKDSDNQDGVRPDSITVRLLANGVEVANKEVTAKDNWSWNFTNLPKYEDGKEISYTVTEDALANYTTTVNGYDITNEHTPGKVSVGVTKSWLDENDQDGVRPEKITVHLYADGEDTGKELTLTKDNNWSGTFTDLAQKKAGKDIKYTVKEEKVDGYTSEVTGDATKGYVVENTHKPATTEIAGSKTWDDKDNQDGKRPESITIHLFANGVEVAKKTVKADDNWSWDFTNLPKYENGKEIIYTVTEDTVKDYTTTVDSYNVTNKHTPETTEISGSKTWDDKDNQDGKRPDKITVRLLANGKEVASKEVTAKDNWSYSFKDLPKYEDGKEIIYTVTEDSVKDYTTKVDGYNVTNSYTPGKVSVPVTKAWNDGNDQDGKRPDKITVHLYADGTDTGKTLELTASNNWSGTFTGLDEYKAGKKISYTVKEDEVKGYTSKVTGDETKGYVVTNTYNPEKTEISGSKTWDDKDNQDGKRPESITIHLFANGEEVATKEVTATDNWSYSFKDLPKYKDGKEITYTITEDKVEGYTTEIKGYNVTNSYTPGKVSVPVTKAWDDNNDQDGVRPEKITVHLYADGTDTGKTLELTTSNNWSGTFTDLDEYKDGKKIEYTVKEDEVKDYTSEVTGDAIKGYVVTNKHTTETTEISGSKTWKDNNDQDGKRPDKIMIRLLANGEEVANKEVTADDNWSYSFKDLPKYADGKEIIYTITEDTVEGYTTTVDGYNVTNSYKPGKTSVTVTKSWKDKNDKDGIRPDEIVIHLYANGEDTGKELVLTEADNWSGSFTNLDEYEAGVKIEYTIEEDEVDGYTSEITGDVQKGYVVTNTHTPKKPHLPGDEGDEDNPKPSTNKHTSEDENLDVKDKADKNKNTSTSTNKSAKTGDTAAVIPWMIVCLTSLGAIVVFRRKKVQK